MNLVGGYESSDDEEALTTPQPSVMSPTLVLPAHQTHQPTRTKTKENRATDTKRAGKRCKRDPKGKERKPKKKESQSSKRKNRTGRVKKIDILILSPEIQAALARRDSLGDSDSDDAVNGAEINKKRTKVVHPPGDPNDLLSLLPQPSTTVNAEEALLKVKRRSQGAAAAKEANKVLANTAPRKIETEENVALESDEGVATVSGPASASKSTGKGPVSSAVIVGMDENENDADDSDEDVLSTLHVKSGEASPRGVPNTAGDMEKSRSTSLFTFPCRSRTKFTASSPTPGSSVSTSKNELGFDGMQKASESLSSNPADMQSNLHDGVSLETGAFVGQTQWTQPQTKSKVNSQRQGGKDIMYTAEEVASAGSSRSERAAYLPLGITQVWCSQKTFGLVWDFLYYNRFVSFSPVFREQLLAKWEYVTVNCSNVGVKGARLASVALLMTS